MHKIILTGQGISPKTLQHPSEIEVYRQYDQMQALGQLVDYTHWRKEYAPVSEVHNARPRYKRYENLRN